METVNAGFKHLVSRNLFYLVLVISCSFYFFKYYENRSSREETNRIQSYQWTDNLRWWISDRINYGEGFDFARAEKGQVHLSIPYNKTFITKETIPPVSNYDQMNYYYSADENTNPVTAVGYLYGQTSFQVKSESSALVSLAASGVPSELLSLVSEQGAQELLNMASALPVSVIEKVKQNPQVLFKAKNMDLLSGIINR